MRTAVTSIGSLVLALLTVLSSASCAVAQENTNVPTENKADARPDQQDRTKAAEAEFKRLTDLRAALEEIPFDGEKREPHASLIKKHEDEIAYNEPAGQWVVRSEKFWDLAAQYKDLPIGDDIAWAAAENPVPGECEGYVPCVLYWLRITGGEYLERFPNGKHSDAAMASLAEVIGDLAKAPGDESSGTWPSEPDEKAEYRKTLEELAAIIRTTESPRKDAVLSDIDKLQNAVR